MFIENLWRIGLLLIFAMVLGVVGNLGTVVACLSAGIKIEKVALGIGAPIFTLKTRVFPIIIGCVPTGGYVQQDMEQYRKRSLRVRWLIVLSGPIAVLVSAALCLGFGGAAAHFVSAYPQFAKGTLHPLTYGRDLFVMFFVKAQINPVAAYGILAAKVIALNMLPFPVATGGRLLSEAVENRENSKAAKYLSHLATAIALPLFVSWTIAFVSFLRH